MEVESQWRRRNGRKDNGDVDGGSPTSPVRAADPLRMVWRRGFIRLIFVSVMVWMLLIVSALVFHVWSCRSSIGLLSAICRKDSKVLDILDTVGIISETQHRCSIPLADNPDSIVIPEKTDDEVLKNLSYIENDEVSISDAHNMPLFGGHQSWEQRENSFKLNSTMEIHCGFMRNGGAEMDDIDIRYAQKCKFVVASGIFDGYDTPHQPLNISMRSKKLFCFLMVVDEKSFEFIKKNVSVQEDSKGGKWVGIWRLVRLRHAPYDEPRRNGKVPKILTHRLFPQAQYSIWIDGKMELVVDPLLMLERYLWRGKNTFAISRHKHHKSIFEEADAIKRRKRYARPLVDLHMKIYRYEGMDLWSPMKGTKSDVPEGAVIIREHTALSNLFSCLWFNEVDLFTPRDQLSFGYVVYRNLGTQATTDPSLYQWESNGPEYQGIAEAIPKLDDFRKISVIPLVFLIFYEVSGGPFGIEDSVKAAGPLLALLGFLVFPIIWSIPEALITAEMGTMFPENGGYVVWVASALGPYWGFQQGWLKWLSGVIDNALYPVLFLDYLKAGIPALAGGLPRVLSVLLLTVGLTYINYRGLTIVGWVAIFLGVFSILTFVIMGFIAIPKLKSARWRVVDLRNVDWNLYLNTLFWNLNYWDSISTLAGEVHNPKKTLPKALFFALVLVVLGYFFPLLIGTGAVQLDRDAWSDGYFSEIAKLLGGAWLMWWLQGASALSNMGMFVAEMSSDSFQLLGVAERGMLPEFFWQEVSLWNPINWNTIFCIWCHPAFMAQLPRDCCRREFPLLFWNASGIRGLH